MYAYAYVSLQWRLVSRQQRHAQPIIHNRWVLLATPIRFFADFPSLSATPAVSF